MSRLQRQTALKEEPPSVTTKVAKGVLEGTTRVGKELAERSVVLGKGVAEGSKILGKGIKEGTLLVGKSTVAAVQGMKIGAEKSYHGFRRFLQASAKTLHLKKPDLRPLDQLEEEINPYLPTEIAKQWYRRNVKLKPHAGQGKFVLEWNKIFCWHDDPFKLDIPQPVDDFFVYDKKKKSTLNLFFVKQYPFGTITGEQGSGKTMFLRWIHWELKEHHPELVPCLVSCTEKTVTEQELIKQVMFPFLNMYQKTVSRPFEELDVSGLAQYVKRKVKNKPFVLLIDEPQNISEKALPLFSTLGKAGVKLQIIVAGEKEQLKKSLVEKGFKDALNFHLDGLDPTLATELLQKRIEAMGGEGTYPFDAQKIRVLCQQVSGNPRKLLQQTKEKVIRLSIDHKEELIAEQQEFARQKEEEEQHKYLKEKEKKQQEREKRRHTIEEERERLLEAQERKKEQEVKDYAATLAREDAALDKIDDMISSIVGQEEKKKEEKSVSKDELRKNDALIADVVNTEKNLEGDAEIADELNQVFAETDKAQKRLKEEEKKSGEKGKRRTG